MTLSQPTVVLAMDPSFAPVLLDQQALSRLGRLGRVDATLIVTDFHDPANTQALAEAEVLITCWGCPPLDTAALSRMPKLRAVIHAAGTVKEHITEACWERDIEVTSVARANALPVAEYTLAAILFASKHVHAIADLYRRERKCLDWAGQFPGIGGYQLTVGIVGASRIGRRVIDLLRPFDVDVLVADPYVTEPLPGTELVTLDALTARSDIVSIHAPELPQTRNMFDHRRLALMKDGATLINTARGSLVDTDALTAELVTGRIHAVIDVTVPAILPVTSPLYDLPNVLLTPHIAGSQGNELRRMADAALDELENYVTGLPFSEPVRPESLAHSA